MADAVDSGVGAVLMAPPDAATRSEDDDHHQESHHRHDGQAQPQREREQVHDIELAGRRRDRESSLSVRGTAVLIAPDALMHERHEQEERQDRQQRQDEKDPVR